MDKKHGWFSINLSGKMQKLYRITLTTDDKDDLESLLRSIDYSDFFLSLPYEKQIEILEVQLELLEADIEGYNDPARLSDFASKTDEGYEDPSKEYLELYFDITKGLISKLQNKPLDINGLKFFKVMPQKG